MHNHILKFCTGFLKNGAQWKLWGGGLLSSKFWKFDDRFWLGTAQGVKAHSGAKLAQPPSCLKMAIKWPKMAQMAQNGKLFIK